MANSSAIKIARILVGKFEKIFEGRDTDGWNTSASVKGAAKVDLIRSDGTRRLFPGPLFITAVLRGRYRKRPLHNRYMGDFNKS